MRIVLDFIEKIEIIFTGNKKTYHKSEVRIESFGWGDKNKSKKCKDDGESHGELMNTEPNIFSNKLLSFPSFLQVS